MADFNISGTYYSAGVPITPSTNPVELINIGTTGTNITGTTANSITQSIIIPADVLTNPCTIDVIARFTKTLFSGGATYRIYINTNNTLTGATLISTLQVTAGGGNIPTFQATRTYFFNGTNLSNNIQASSANVTDIATQVSGLQMSVAYNSTLDYYLIFAIQLTIGTDSSVINGYRILKYGIV